MDTINGFAEPTFSYDGPFTHPGGGGDPTNSDLASISLSKDVTNVQVGDNFTVDVSLDSHGQLIESFEITVNYDASTLEVQDADTSVEGTQGRLMFQYYNVQTNEATQTGELGALTIGAAAPTSATNDDMIFADRRVIQVNFKALNSGVANVFIEPSTSDALTPTGAEILKTGDQVSITIGNQSQSTSSSTITQTSSTLSTNTTTSSAYTTSQLANTGIFDTTGITGPILAGLVLIYIGIRAVIQKSKDSFWQ